MHRQRKGIGEALLLYLEAVCPTEKLFISTNLSNKQMQRLCRRLGYMPSGMIDNLDPGDPEVFSCKKPQRS
ncbi:GNAT family N-acetyltransferase [Brevibacillus thermoruber]|uniref:GNAT family N-acetyltransferase n=1 Tax=Brevibacillus thermoruber TaxID=33942 RepID=UPI000AEFAE6E|nr:GNAT family N-acetyltransferase [Brevibacillus thermoruber]